MSVTLEDHIRRLAAAGALERLSVVKTAQGYQANFGVGGNSSRVDIRTDPVEALLIATGAVVHPNLRSRESDVDAMLA